MQKGEKMLGNHRLNSRHIMLLISVLIVLLLVLLFFKTSINVTSHKTTTTLKGATDINPSVMYQNKIYSLENMAGPTSKLPKGSLPKGYTYVGDITEISGTNLKEDFQFIAKFPATGQLYYNENKKDQLIVCITTDWLKDAYVVFKAN